MAIYLISYDLRKPGQNYSGLITEIKRSSDWLKPLESVFLVHTNESATALFNRLRKHLDTNDHILITSIGRDHQGWLPQVCWNWMNKYIHHYAAT